MAQGPHATQRTGVTSREPRGGGKAGTHTSHRIHLLLSHFCNKNEHTGQCPFAEWQTNTQWTPKDKEPAASGLEEQWSPGKALGHPKAPKHPGLNYRKAGRAREPFSTAAFPPPQWDWNGTSGRPTQKAAPLAFPRLRPVPGGAQRQVPSHTLLPKSIKFGEQRALGTFSQAKVHI